MSSSTSGGARVLPNEVAEAVKLVAAEEIMPRYLKVARQHKDDGSLFTEADLAAQHVLSKKLQAILPVPVLGEEMEAAEQQSLWKAGHEGLWCVDPIDGTSNFVRGLPYFAVSVALLRAGKSVMGVVYNPVSNEMFVAERGKGAFLNDERLEVRGETATLKQALAAVDLKRLDKTLTVKLESDSPYCSQRNFGASALDWCYTAAGRFDIYLHGGQSLWDYAAGELVLSEAGGHYCCIENDSFVQGNIWQRSVIAAGNKQLFEEWKSWIRK